jgi:hypothetical protein
MLKDLYGSKKMNCGICRVLFEELESKLNSKLGDVKKSDARTIDVKASLFIPTPREDHLYCLKFKLRYEKIQCQRSFVLRETGKRLDLLQAHGLQTE